MRSPTIYTLSMVEVSRCVGESFEHRLLRLFDLQQQGRAVVRHEEPYGTKCADTADSDGLERDVATMIAL